jgi:hypothetical protein
LAQAFVRLSQHAVDLGDDDGAFVLIVRAEQAEQPAQKGVVPA